jgi:LacI family repressor for deo operon, udp, cdd, tsx, nupC, and nupG
VSLALNDAPGVKEETRQRVKECARRLRYRPNASARAIKAGRTQLVAAVLGRLTDSFFEEIVQGVENVADRHGYDVLVSSVGDHSQPEAEFVERLVARHIDGVIGAFFALSPAAIARFGEVGIPLVMLRPRIEGEQPCLAVDNVLGGRLAAEHLLELGHRRALYLGGEDIFGCLRGEGARNAFAARGGMMEECAVPQDLDLNAAREAVMARLARGHDFTAIFCADDVLAVGAGHALHEAGLRVPEDVSVVGFDDLRWTRLLSPPLTTVHQPQVAQGEAAMTMLADLMRGQAVESRALEPRLIVRASTGPAPKP